MDSPNLTFLLDVKYGFCGMLGTILFFHALNRVVTFIGPPVIILSNGGGKEAIWKWRNLVLSWVHGLVVGVWDLLCFYFYPEVQNDLIEHITPFTYYLVVVSTGYFLYDFGDMIVHHKIFKMWELTLHHIAVSSMFFYNMVTLRCIGYNVVALLAEVNSFFLHTRKLLQMVQYNRDRPLYRLVAICNIITFAVCRGYGLGRITYGMYSESHRVDRVYFCVLTGSMIIMNMLNPVLFWILLKNDFLRSRTAGDRRKQKEKHLQQPAKVNGASGSGESCDSCYRAAVTTANNTTGHDHVNRLESNGTCLSGHSTSDLLLHNKVD